MSFRLWRWSASSCPIAAATRGSTWAITSRALANAVDSRLTVVVTGVSSVLTGAQARGRRRVDGAAPRWSGPPAMRQSRPGESVVPDRPRRPARPTCRAGPAWVGGWHDDELIAGT